MAFTYKTHYIENGLTACSRPIKKNTKVSSRVSEMTCDDCLKMLYVYPKDKPNKP